ncbi:hypothetical protein QOZ80_6BG0489210 [Eleusine coracana subsp. coracana]|nr:hypothetical protein QOZ80_6BG0489210 [Eleusine coracana subsp. coracana]
MEFARLSSSTSAADIIDDGRRFPDLSLPPHGDSMQVIRDALLSQLQKDRLRQEIIVAELSKIECAMALRSTVADAERTKPAPFDFDEQHMTHGTGKADDMKKEDGVRRRRRGKRSKEPHVTKDGIVSESWKACSSTREVAGDKKNLRRDDEGKPQESNEAKKSPSMKWNCVICRVEATSAGNLLQHFSGQKHQANAHAVIEKAKAEKSRKSTECAEKPCPLWVCRFCQANCTGKSDLENHLKGKKHHAKIQALLEECKSLARDSASREADSSQDEEKTASESICCICQKFGAHADGKGFVFLQALQFAVQQRNNARSPSCWEKASGKAQ